MQSADLRVHYFQHIRDEGYGSLQSFWQQMGASLSQTAFYALPQGEIVPSLPDFDAVDMLVVMGGSMSVNDEAIYPWLKQEKAWIKAFIEQDKPVIGLCLGAQLIANSLGAVVGLNDQQELGWWPIHRVSLEVLQTLEPKWATPLFDFPDRITALSWHAETFDLPQGAVLLAASAACARQAYQYKHNVLGFQFHPEATPESLALYLHREEICDDNGGYVQSLAQLTATPVHTFDTANQLLQRAAMFVLSRSGWHF